MEIRSFSRGLFAAGCFLAVLGAQAQTKPIPEIVKKDGRFALLVDGAPYLILGAQCHNSSAWPAMLPKVWRAREAQYSRLFSGGGLRRHSEGYSRQLRR